MDQHSVKQLLAQVMQLLLNGNYGEVERLTNGQRYPADELKRAMESHYEKLAMPPDGELSRTPLIMIWRAAPNTEACAVTADFWVEGNYRSDLSLECTFCQIPGQPLSVQIDNLHVM